MQSAPLHYRLRLPLLLYLIGTPLYAVVITRQGACLHSSFQFQGPTPSLLSCHGGSVPSSSPALSCVHLYLLVEISRPGGFPMEELRGLSEITPASSFRFYQDPERS